MRRMKLQIQIPPDLRQRVVDDKAHLQTQCDGVGQARDAIQSQIKELEGTQATLIPRIATLTAKAVDSDDAAAELTNVERRAAAIRTRLDQLRAKPIPMIDLGKTFGVMFALVYFWKEEVKSQFLLDLELWGIGANEMHLFHGHVVPLSALANISHWLGTAPHPTANNIARITAIYARALRGERDLSRDTISEAAPAQLENAQTTTASNLTP
jgi:hypothetical protein